jgi:hypothetical protein
MTPQEQGGFVDDIENTCDGPCPPNDTCNVCYSYWERMVSEGYWDRERNQWTEAGMRQIVRDAK